MKEKENRKRGFIIQLGYDKRSGGVSDSDRSGGTYGSKKKA